MWNLHDRIKKGLPTTNNLVEVWHGAISADAKKHLTVNKTVELLRKEQGMMEVKILKAINGEDVVRIQKGSRLTKDSNIKRIVNSYKSANIYEHLTGLANNMGDLKLN